MLRPNTPPRSGQRPGFTLAEVAVTIVIVGIALVLCLQGLNGAKLQAAWTRNFKLARELGSVTLGEVASGLYSEDIADGLSGTYSDADYSEFSYEVVAGDDELSDTNDEDNGRYDSWNRDDENDDEEDDEEAEEPYEKIKVRVRFPEIGDYPAEVILEQWIEWTLVYGEEEDDTSPGGL